MPQYVIPAKAGIHVGLLWIPAFAGMTSKCFLPQLIEKLLNTTKNYDISLYQDKHDIYLYHKNIDTYLYHMNNYLVEIERLGALHIAKEFFEKISHTTIQGYIDDSILSGQMKKALTNLISQRYKDLEDYVRSK